MWHIWRFVLLKKMGIQGQSLQDLAECALLHDNAVAQYIQEELQNDALRNGVTKLGRHCTIGEKILKNIPFHNDVLSDGTLWEAQTALCFRCKHLSDCAVPVLAADSSRDGRRLS